MNVMLASRLEELLATFELHLVVLPFLPHRFFPSNEGRATVERIVFGGREEVHERGLRCCMRVLSHEGGDLAEHAIPATQRAFRGVVLLPLSISGEILLQLGFLGLESLWSG